MDKLNFDFIRKEENLDLEQTRKSLTYWQDVWRRLKKNKMSMFGLAVVILVIIFAIFGPMFTPFSFEDQVTELRNLPPRVDVYEIAPEKYIHRTEAYNLIEFDDEGNILYVLKQINPVDPALEYAPTIYKYSYLTDFGYGDIAGGEYLLPDTVTLNENSYYSEIWGIALFDRIGNAEEYNEYVFEKAIYDTVLPVYKALLAAAIEAEIDPADYTFTEPIKPELVLAEKEVVVDYVHPDSPLNNGNVIEGVDVDNLEGSLIDQFIMLDDLTEPEIPNYYTVKASTGARLVIKFIDKKIFGQDAYPELSELALLSDLVVLDYTLRGLDSDVRPEGYEDAAYEDVDYIVSYHGEETTKIADTFKNSMYPWGTDALGRDVLTRVMYGARISLLVALIATVVNFVIGITYGSISGYAGGNVDNLMMRWVDIINSIPLVLYVILLMVLLREVNFTILFFTFNGSDGFTTIVIALGSVYWVGMARLVRGQVLGLKEQEYVLAARTIGVPTRKIIMKHLIPNALGPIIVSLTMMIPSAVFTEAFLSFIGIGVSAPQASWGTLANEALGGILRYQYQLVFPSLAIAITMLGFNFLGDGLRDALDPRLRKG